ncbi:30S ribosomal protein S7 [Candidatus Hodgkinia cicadicola]|nr:30S ribosomal protein S7 [Candidatus Hodgkinia cicadicola]
MSRRYKLRRTRRLNTRDSDVIVAKLVNYLMISGKKRAALKTFDKALNFIKTRTKGSPVKALYEALSIITPYSEVRSKKVGGVSYQVPVDITSERRLSLSLKWLVTSAKSRKEANMWMRLAQEIIDTVKLSSATYKKSQALQELVFANQAFSHLGW